MARLIHLSDLHFGAHDPRLVEAVEAAHRRGEARPGRHQRRLHPARPDRAVQGGVRVPRAAARRRPRSARRARQPRRAAVRRAAPLPVAADPLPALHRRHAVPVHRAARRGGARDQHGAVADLQGRPDQRRADALHPRDLRAHRAGHAAHPRHPPSLVRAAGRRRARSWARRSAGRNWRSTRSPRPASTCCWPATITAPRPTCARDLVTRAGSALVVQAGTATSTRLRDEEQSFNRIEIDEGERDGDGAGAGTATASSPRDASSFVREGDHWRHRRRAAGRSADDLSRPHCA